MAMLLNDKQYKNTLKKIKESKAHKKEITKDLKGKKGLFNNAITGSLDCWIKDLEFEVKEYENIKAGKIPKYMRNIENLGYLLCALRIKNGMTQSQLARKLKITTKEVQKNEYNEYHGVDMITVKKLLNIFKTSLNVTIK